MAKPIPFITPGRRPTIPEIRAYYATPGILNELMLGMQRWHVRFVPGSERQSWTYTEDPSELQALLNCALDTMEKDAQLTEYPYFRINYARYKPAQSWKKSDLWGYDFVIEKDSPLWQDCFEAMLPVMDILDYFGVYYWLKYTGHHSLHLIIPAEVFPTSIRGVALTDCYEAVQHRLMVFLNRRSNQYFNEHDRHCPPGTNMPYSVNEDTGLVNLPLFRKDLASFRPWHASIHLVEPCDYWRKVPQESWGCGTTLLEEVLKSTNKQQCYYAGVSKYLIFDKKKAQETAENPRYGSLCMTKKQAISKITCSNLQQRLHAVWSMMILATPETIPYLVQALSDKHADIRWFAAEGLVRIGTLSALSELLAMEPDDMAGACLVDFCVRHGEVTIPSLIQALCSRFKSPYNSLPLDKILERMGKTSVPHIRNLLTYKNPSLRKVAANLLQILSGTPDLDEVLVRTKRHNRKSNTVSMLGWFDSLQVYSHIKELSLDMHNDRTRRECIKTLLWNDHPDTEELLLKALEDPSKKVRNWAKHYLILFKQLKKMAVV